jgi:hypothetical protein
MPLLLRQGANECVIGGLDCIWVAKVCVCQATIIAPKQSGSGLLCKFYDRDRRTKGKTDGQTANPFTKIKLRVHLPFTHLQW